MKFAWFLLATPLLGQYLPNVQFSNLATSRDGTILYFSSPLSLRGDNEQPYQKIFRIDSAGIRPVVQIAPVPPKPVPNFSNFYLAIEPDLSADGRVFSYVASRTCFGGSACTFFELYVSHLPVGGAEAIYSGQTTLSRDGRYALLYGSTGIPGLSGPIPALIDLSTGARIPVPGYTPDGRALASGGTVLTVINNALILWSQTGSTPVSLSASGRTVLSDNAAVIVAESAYASGEPLSLLLYDIGAGKSSVLDQGSTSGYDASVTDDGRLVCYLRNSQVVLYDRTMQSEVPLGTTPDGVVEAVVSGDGGTIWVATAAGRIVRLDVASGSAQQLVPRTPLITLMLGAPVPGSLNWVYGGGLSSSSTSAPLPLPEFVLEPTSWLSLLVGSIPGRLASVTPNQILYQIPWEVPPGTWGLSLYPNDSPFAQPTLSIDVVPYSPRPVALPPTDEPVIANNNFTALVNAQNPAHPGDAVHVYFTGLGPVSPPLPSGVPAPLNILEPAVQKPSCEIFAAPGQLQPAQILFAGMAPGIAGIYQVDIQLPSKIPILDNNGITGSASFICGDNLGGENFFDVPMEPVHN